MSEPDAPLPLLDYAIISEPFPLYATTGTDDPATALHIVVSNGGGETVYCREIVFYLPKGDLAQSLVNAPAGDGWAKDWDVVCLQPGTQTALPSGDYARFQATPKGDDKKKTGVPVDASGLVITLKDLKISPLPGTARIEIREFATTNTDQWPENPRFTKLALTKFPAPKIPAMAVSDFTADKLEVTAGTSVRLTWSGPSTLDYTVSHGGSAHPVGKQHGYSTTIDRDTTFQLSYVTGGTTHALTTTVTVTNPKLTGLTVDGDVKVTGATGVQGLTASGDLKAEQALTVSGAADLQGLTVHKDLTAKAALSAEKDLALAGTLNIANWKIFQNQYTNLKVRYQDTDMFDVESSSKLFTMYGALGLDKYGINDGEWSKLKNFTDGNAKFNFWNECWNDTSHEASVFVYRGDTHLPVYADFGSKGVYHDGGVFRLAWN
ncbi:hypothetical protein SLV14_001586 [Streptomyces sp. Je 1-4]|uniref:hypothetical protein n=1 Tax=Streptomyces TaxID=1883 RepID=UPI0021DB36C2|nr:MULTISPECIES: hypothetical protein [unclassified Streptomyces]UYB39130.1 hypothetical protein SLV14_001586 [Streptomyces sp. Je 1-4]UZQ35138.1 hypothetical protein SLV14N_001586 [Streptomyces sp. Je 1-4] [Streptomyces sp. Je 1-4 4N24]UZQ42556.1 hypothetical protein SLV14NA_001586 [Streptomyces sp. Je 1-4] [Streptomyces sp. Je 1-4 4N24_ara]